MEVLQWENTTEGEGSIKQMIKRFDLYVSYASVGFQYDIEIKINSTKDFVYTFI